MMKSSLLQIVNYIKNNWIISLIALYAIDMVIPPLPFNVPVYYVMLVGMFVYMLTRPGIKVNQWAALFIAIAAISILVDNPPAVFRSWERLGLLVVVIGAVFPLFQTYKADCFHSKLLKVTLWLFVIVGVVSFFCYLLGINYMNLWNTDPNDFNLAGGFGGITQHSMILGPFSSFGAIYLVCKIIYGKYTRTMKICLWTVVGLCVISSLLSASRASLICEIIGIILCVYFRYQGQFQKFVGIVVMAIIVLVASFPFYSKYATGLMAKQSANELAGGTFSSRDEKWTNRINEFEQNPFLGVGFAAISLDTAEGQSESTMTDGVVEPGSSWLASLSMVGLLGSVPFFLLVFGTVYRLYRRVREVATFRHTALLALLVASVLHQFAEGYALAGGSYLCFFFWLLLGVGAVYASHDYSEVKAFDF